MDTFIGGTTHILYDDYVLYIKIIIYTKSVKILKSFLHPRFFSLSEDLELNWPVRDECYAARLRKK